jgi:hypothetical protein
MHTEERRAGNNIAYGALKGNEVVHTAAVSRVKSFHQPVLWGKKRNNPSVGD